MFLKVARAIARPQTFAILDLLKRSAGLSVNEIAKSLKLSYMGVKQYCNELEKKGLLDTWRRPKDLGRPEKSYRLTEKSAMLYPEVGNELSLDILESAQQLYGTSAPDKLLFNYFAKKADFYQKKIKSGSLAERLVALAKLRDAEGYCAQIEQDASVGACLVEYHSPLRTIAQAFPSVHRMEEMVFSRVLGIPVTRSETSISGLVRIVFLIGQVDAPAVQSSVLVDEATAEVEEIQPEETAEIEIELEAEATMPEVICAEVTETPVVAEMEPTELEDEAELSVMNMLAPPSYYEPAISLVPAPEPTNIIQAPNPQVSEAALSLEQDEFRLVG
jgi:predicted ArsR family transcriptional regulator